MLQIIKPIVVALYKTQKYDCSIEDASKIWLIFFDDEIFMEIHEC